MIDVVFDGDMRRRYRISLRARTILIALVALVLLFVTSVFVVNQMRTRFYEAKPAAVESSHNDVPVCGSGSV